MRSLGDRLESLSETDADRWLEGEAGGGIDALLDRRARGVVIVRGRVGVPVGGPIVPGAVRPALGVNGEPGARGGDVRCAAGRVGEAKRRVAVGLPIAGLMGLLAPIVVRLLSCFAVIPTYLDARDPGVIMDSTGAVLLGVTTFLVTVMVLGRVVFNPPPGVRLPTEVEGVTLPLCEAGVTRPFESDGVLGPFALTEEDNEGVTLPENEGVTRPLRLEATEEGLEIDPAPTVGEESLEAATNTPKFGAQVKYRLLHHDVRRTYE